MRKPILIAAMIAAFAAPAFADELTLKDVRAMSDDELYALAATLSSDDETRLYQRARKEFPEGALGLQSVRNELAKREEELEICERAIEDNKPSNLRALNEREPGRYFDLLRIVTTPSSDVLDMTPDERKASSKEATRTTNRVLRSVRNCKRAYRKKFGSD
jgi:hypothetical protein